VENAEKAARSVAGVARVEAREEAGCVRVTCGWSKKLGEEDIALATERIVAALVAAELFLREVRPVGGSLEEVFSSLTEVEESAA
jgi:hypothetical protein